MIRRRGVKCNACGNCALVTEGGGPGIYLLHCDTCGEPKVIHRDEVMEAHLRYLKGLPESGRQLEADYDPERVASCPGDPLDLEQYLAAIEVAAGICACGGCFSLEAPPRCPVCRSTDLDDDPGGPGILYD
jgi:hypothetical protein